MATKKKAAAAAPETAVIEPAVTSHPSARRPRREAPSRTGVDPAAITGNPGAKVVQIDRSVEEKAFDQRRKMIEQAHALREEMADDYNVDRDVLDLALGGKLPPIPPARR